MAVLREARNWRRCRFGSFQAATFPHLAYRLNKAVFSPTRTIKYQVDIPSPSPVTPGGRGDSQTNHSCSGKQLRLDPPFIASLVSHRENSLVLRSVSHRISGFHSQWRPRFLRDGTD